MIPVDINQIKSTAIKEMAEERTKVAVKMLKELCSKKEKAQLVVRNIETEILSYEKEISDNLTYLSAGVDIAPKA